MKKLKKFILLLFVTLMPFSAVLIEAPIAVFATTWVTTLSSTFDHSTGLSSVKGFREVISASSLSASGYQVRITLSNTGAGAGYIIGSMYVGTAADSGDVFDFKGDQQQVKVAGSASFTVPDGSSVVSDPISLVLNKANNLVISWKDTGSSNFTEYNDAAADTYRYVGASTDDTATTNATTADYLTWDTGLYLVTLIEVDTDAPIRRMRLFQGATVKIIGNRIIIK